MHITRLKPTTDLADLARTLSDMRPERGAPTRFALVTAKGEGQTHAFLVAADKKSKDWQLLDTAGHGSTVILTAKEANGSATEMGGKVEHLVEGRSFGVWATSYITRVLGAGAAFAGGGSAALYGLGGRLLMDGSSAAILGVFGLVAVAGVAASYAGFTRETDNRDYARREAESHHDGAGVEGTIKSVEKPAPVDVPVAALPAPSEPPMVIPFELARTPVLAPTKSS